MLSNYRAQREKNLRLTHTPNSFCTFFTHADWLVHVFWALATTLFVIPRTKKSPKGVHLSGFIATGNKSTALCFCITIICAEGVPSPLVKLSQRLDFLQAFLEDRHFLFGILQLPAIFFEYMAGRVGDKTFV